MITGNPCLRCQGRGLAGKLVPLKPSPSPAAAKVAKSSLKALFHGCVSIKEMQEILNKLAELLLLLGSFVRRVFR